MPLELRNAALQVYNNRKKIITKYKSNPTIQDLSLMKLLRSILMKSIDVAEFLHFVQEYVTNTLLIVLLL